MPLVCRHTPAASISRSRTDFVSAPAWGAGAAVTVVSASLPSGVFLAPLDRFGEHLRRTRVGSGGRCARGLVDRSNILFTPDGSVDTRQVRSVAETIQQLLRERLADTGTAVRFDD